MWKMVFIRYHKAQKSWKKPEKFGGAKWLIHWDFSEIIFTRITYQDNEVSFQHEAAKMEREP